MTIPSGGGTEVAKVGQARAVTDSWSDLITGVANHIYIIKSMIITNTTFVDESISVYTRDNTSDVNLQFLLHAQALPSASTFVWNDVFFMSGVKLLSFNAGTTADIDVWVSYIDQDWT